MPKVSARANHLRGVRHRRQNQLLAAWETSTRTGELLRSDTSRKLYVQALDRATGAANGPALQVDVKGNRYQDFVAFPDGSVAFAAPGSSATRIKILRVLPCTGRGSAI
ncbi:hypothetical protein JRI60_48070 [Archangium violaceum]|uniref:hypothetical protein n=1 Tax=Archangium violaceum TaxID=83451 RepID=UPI00194EDE14|nr:hypothetical protein [Archangium violaceum]QRN96665.1 hypothetical protein JRI60_48070 [Archangium violaceum]